MTIASTVKDMGRRHPSVTLSTATFSGWRITTLLLVVAVSLPLFLPATYLNFAIKMLVAGLFALAANLLWGHTRLLSFGHAAYYAIGAFSVVHVLLAVEKGGASFPTPLIPVVGLVAGAVAGAVVGWFATIRSGTYFAMITLAVAELIFSIAPKWQSVFGGEAGLSSMRAPWAGFGFGTVAEVYFVVLLWFVAGVLLLRWFSATPLGRIAMAIGDNETRVQFLGYRTHVTKTVVFAISAAVSGLAGGLLAFSMESASTELFAGANSSLPVMHAFLGGAGVFLGPVLGGMSLTLFSQIASGATRLWLLYMGLIFIVVVVFAPAGLGGLITTHMGLRASSWRRLLPSYSILLISLVLLALSSIWIAEVAYRLIGTSPVLRVSAEGTVNVFGLAFQAISPGLWALAIVVFVLSLVGVTSARKVSSAVWRVIGQERTHG